MKPLLLINHKRGMNLGWMEKITINIEEKRNLCLKSTVGGVEIEPFK